MLRRSRVPYTIVRLSRQETLRLVWHGRRMAPGTCSRLQCVVLGMCRVLYYVVYENISSQPQP
jgi:hypothetical protein